MATIKYKDENGQWQEIAVGGGESSSNIYPIYTEPTEEQKALNAKAFASVIAGENAAYYVDIEGSKAFLELVFKASSEYIIFLASQINVFEGGDNSLLQFSNITMGPDGSVYTANYDTRVPSVEQVQQMIQEAGGSGGGVKMYQVYLDPANDDEKSVNIEAYNAIRDAEDALYYFEIVDDLSNVVRYMIESPSFIDDMAIVFAIARNVAYDDAKVTGLAMHIWGRSMMSDGSTTEFLVGLDSQFRIPSTEVVEEVIAASIGDINTILDNINGEEI